MTVTRAAPIVFRALPSRFCHGPTQQRTRAAAHTSIGCPPVYNRFAPSAPPPAHTSLFDRLQRGAAAAAAAAPDGTTRERGRERERDNSSGDFLARGANKFYAAPARFSIFAACGFEECASGLLLWLFNFFERVFPGTSAISFLFARARGVFRSLKGWVEIGAVRAVCFVSVVFDCDSCDWFLDLRHNIASRGNL